MLANIYDWIINFINNMATASIIFNCFLIVIESIIPILPLSVFITILFVNYGAIIGFLLSWIFTVLGCVMSFYLFQTVFQKFVDKKLRNYKMADKLLSIIDNISFTGLVMIVSMPFTPAFLVNIISGVSKMNIKKFLPAIALGKISLVIFWGYIGTTLLESLKDPMQIIKVIILMMFAFIFSKLINKYFKID